MYLPKIFKSENFNVLKDIVDSHPFSNFIIYNNKIMSTRAMMMITGDENDYYIETHLNKANPVALKVNPAQEVLCDFLGANTYISSSWYDHINASTWNYEQVQIYGKLEIMSNQELYHHLDKLTNRFEISQQCPMTLDKMGKDFVETEMKGTIGYKIIPTEVKIKQKLSQNRDEQNFHYIIEHLLQSDESMDKIIAQKMIDLKPK